MKSRKIWLVMCILAFVFVISSCGLKDELTTVPSWAQGTWYIGTEDGAARIRAARITDKELIPEEGLNSLFSLLGDKAKLEKTEVTVVTNKTVFFDLIQVKKGDNAKEVEIGIPPITIKIYK